MKKATKTKYRWLFKTIGVNKTRLCACKLKYLLLYKWFWIFFFFFLLFQKHGSVGAMGNETFCGDGLNSSQTLREHRSGVCLLNIYYRIVAWAVREQYSWKLATILIENGQGEWIRDGIFTVKLPPFSGDTRPSKTKHPRKRFQNFRQSYMLLAYRIEIHQSQHASMA